MPNAEPRVAARDNKRCGDDNGFDRSFERPIPKISTSSLHCLHPLHCPPHSRVLHTNYFLDLIACRQEGLNRDIVQMPAAFHEELGAPLGIESVVVLHCVRYYDTMGDFFDVYLELDLMCV